MAGKFNNTGPPYTTDNSKVDLRTYWLKASDYIYYLAKEAGAEHEKFIQNALRIVSSFCQNHSLINSQVEMVEQRLWKRIEQRRRGNSNLPDRVFKDGVINVGKVHGSNIDAKMKVGGLITNIRV